MKRHLVSPALLCTLLFTGSFARSQAPSVTHHETVIIDTDIGDDIDDAFAVTLALRSPELKVLGFTTTFGDTPLRARLLSRLLADTGHAEIPVAMGKPTADAGTFTQQRYALAHAGSPAYEDALSFLERQIAAAPGEITLIAIGPLGNVGALIDKDPAVFRKLKRVVIMGGSVDRGYGDLDFGPASAPDPEWNILKNPSAAQKLFTSGVPLFVLPLDSTQLRLDEVKRSRLFRQGNAYTDALTLLYTQWGQQTPTLFDPMTVAWLLQPSLCPMQRIRLRVDEKGYTRRESGAPNANVCLHSSPEAFFRFFLPRLLTGP